MSLLPQRDLLCGCWPLSSTNKLSPSLAAGQRNHEILQSCRDLGHWELEHAKEVCSEYKEPLQLSVLLMHHLSSSPTPLSPRQDGAPA